MSQTLALTERNIRNLINDTKDGNFVVSRERMRLLISQEVQRITHELSYADTWLTGAITLAAGTRDYTMPAGEYRVIAELKLASTGRLLVKRPWDAIDGLLRSNATYVGTPTDYAVYEDGSQQAQIRLYPTPNAVDTMDAFVSTAPATLTADSSVIGLGIAALNIVETRVAKRCVAALTPDQMDMLKMGQGAVGDFAEAEQLLMQQELQRGHQLRRTDHIEMVRY